MQLAFDHITVDPLHGWDQHGIQVSVLRLDRVHPVISGNKWFKLQYYLKEARELRKKKIITWGGAWSNHIVATAAACKMNELACTGIIRGEEPALLSDTLIQAKEYGMDLHFISREDYRDKNIPAELQNGDHYFIPEGGYGEKGAAGAAQILDHCEKDFTHYCCAVGTGTMMAGLTAAASLQQEVIGVSVLKNNRGLEKAVQGLLPTSPKKWSINHDYHFGGYAKHSSTLIAFMNEFYRQTGIPSDFVYTAKLFFAVSDMANKNIFPAGSKILAVHSGGLQGNNSLGKGTLIY